MGEEDALFCRDRVLLGLSRCASIGGGVPAAGSAFGQRRATRSLQGLAPLWPIARRQT